MLFFKVDAYQAKIFFSQKTKNFLGKVLVVRKIVVPLHPLSGRDLMSMKKKSSLRVLHKTEEVVVQEARDFVSLG
jgi:hypothetical protein